MSIPLFLLENTRFPSTNCTNFQYFLLIQSPFICRLTYHLFTSLAIPSAEQDGQEWTDHDCLQYCYDAVLRHYATNYKDIYDTDDKVEQLKNALFKSFLDIEAYNRALGLGEKLAEVAHAAYCYDPDETSNNFIAPDFRRYRWPQNFAKSTHSKYEIKLQISHKLTEKEAQLAKEDDIYIDDEYTAMYTTGYDYVNGKLYLSSISRSELDPRSKGGQW